MKPDTLLRLPEVEAAVGLKKSKIYTLIQKGRFPQPVKLGPRTIRWKASTIDDWIDSLPTANITEENQ